jgi:hypothetical protein
VIRQSISCDVCGTEKKQSNHWFVAHEQAGELRLSGWSSRYRSRAGSKHLCGHTCLHKLVDDFMVRSQASRAQDATPESAEATAPVPASGAPHAASTDTSLTADAAHLPFESSARLLTPTPLPAKRPVAAVTAGPIPVPNQVRVEGIQALPVEGASFQASRSFPAEAWQRERERELRSANRRPDSPARRRI